MNYCELHLGDYEKATAHLTACEDGTYGRLMRWYYDIEGPLPLDMKAIQRRVRARSREELKAVETILVEFFIRLEDGYHQTRCDVEIVRYRDKQAKAKRSAEARWNAIPPDSDGNANASPDAMRTHSEGNAPRARSSLQSPVNSKEDAPDGALSAAAKPPADAVAPECPQTDIVAMYHRRLPGLARVREWTTERQRILRQRWREKPERQSLAWWEEFFGYVLESDFLMGRTPSRTGSAFECDLEWLIRPKNFVKVIEGKYENRGAA